MRTAGTIVVGYDGSPDADAALQWAATLAVSCAARLRIVHAVGLLEHAGLSAHSGLHQASALERAMEAGLDPSLIEWLVVDGDPCSALLRMTVSPECADLVVVGSRGSGAHPGTLLGSTSLELVEHSTVPVTVVPNSSQGEEKMATIRVLPTGSRTQR